MENQSKVMRPEDLVEYKVIPLPHILGSKGKAIRLVDIKDYNEGDFIREHLDKVYDEGVLVGRDRVWQITNMHVKRQAKGDWSAWGGTPFYYEVETTWIGIKKENEV